MFVKVCPKCTHTNPEYLSQCERCQLLIAHVAAIPESGGEIADEAHVTKDSDIATVRQESIDSTELELKSKNELMSAHFYLAMTKHKEIYTIYHESFLGLENPIPNEILGAEYCHQKHCQFILKGKCWFVVAVSQETFGGDFTNPSYLNQKRLPLDTPYPIVNGDNLSLCDIAFKVKVVAT